MQSPDQRQQIVNEVVDKLTKEHADRGMIMEGGWQAFLVVGMPSDASDLQKSEMRKAYYLGAQHLFASIMGILDPGTEPTEQDMQRMTLISKELERFTQEMKRKQN